jgi:hypothetical protein
MAAEAGARRDTGMIKGGQTPGTGGVAVIAGITTLDVARGLARSRDAVVTAGTGTDDGVMVHPCKRIPELIRVAFLTQRKYLHMARW